MQLVVVDLRGSPVEGAAFTLAAYRQPRGSPAPTKFARYETDSAGTVSIRMRGDWLLPDGSSWYAWRYCIEKGATGPNMLAEASASGFGNRATAMEFDTRRSSWRIR